MYGDLTKTYSEDYLKGIHANYENYVVSMCAWLRDIQIDPDEYFEYLKSHPEFKNIKVTKETALRCQQQYYYNIFSWIREFDTAEKDDDWIFDDEKLANQMKVTARLVIDDFDRKYEQFLIDESDDTLEFTD